MYKVHAFVGAKKLLDIRFLSNKGDKYDKILFLNRFV